MMRRFAQGDCRRQSRLLVVRCAVMLGLVLLRIAVPEAVAQEAVTEVTVMSYNILVGGTGLGQPLSKTVEVITAAGADIVGLQEQGGSGRAIADALGFSYFDQGGSTAVLSRYPIVAASPNRWGVTLQLSDQQQANLFNAHLAPYPYQPYDIRDG